MWQAHFASRCCWRGAGRSSASMKPGEYAVFSVGPYSFSARLQMRPAPTAQERLLTEKATASLRFLTGAGQLPVAAGDAVQECGAIIRGSPPTPGKPDIYRLRQKIEKDAPPSRDFW